MTGKIRTRSRVSAAWLALVAAAALALAACSGSGTQNGASFGTGDDGSGTTPMESTGVGY